MTGADHRTMRRVSAEQAHHDSVLGFATAFDTGDGSWWSEVPRPSAVALAPRWLRRGRALEVLQVLDRGEPLALPWRLSACAFQLGSVAECLLTIAGRVGAHVVNWPRRALRPRTMLSAG